MAEIARILLAERLGMVIGQAEGKQDSVRSGPMPVILLRREEFIAGDGYSVWTACPRKKIPNLRIKRVPHI